MYDLVLVPLDGSVLAEKAAAYAAQFSRLCESELLLVRVCAAKSEYREAVDYLDEVNRQAHFEGIRCRAEAHVGDPAREIVRAADESQADLIIICSHGRTGLARSVFGSVAETVVRTGDCPVMGGKGSRGALEEIELAG